MSGQYGSTYLGSHARRRFNEIGGALPVIHHHQRPLDYS